MQLTIPCRGIWRGLEQCRSSPCESTVFPTQPLQRALVESLFTLAQCHHGCLYHSKLKSDINNASSIVFLVTNFFSAPEKENKSYSYSTTQIPWKVKIYLNVSCQWNISNIQKEKKIHLKWPQKIKENIWKPGYLHFITSVSALMFDPSIKIWMKLVTGCGYSRLKMWHIVSSIWDIYSSQHSLSHKIFLL